MMTAHPSQVQIAKLPSLQGSSYEDSSYWQICTATNQAGERTPVSGVAHSLSGSEAEAEEAYYRRYDAPGLQLLPQQATWTTSVGVSDLAQTDVGEVYYVQPTDQGDANFETPNGRAPGYHRRANPNSTTAEAQPVKERYKRLISEAAHDLRSPIATASQLITTVAERARDLGNVTPAELDMLDIANQRLAQASNWAAGILIDRRLEQLSAIAIKKRFYPQQWQALMLPLLDAVAKDHNVRLLWMGWDRSLPRVYLDVNHASRVLLNLVTNAIQASSMGSQITIRVEQSRAPATRVLVHVEDQGNGLDGRLMSIVNSQNHVDEPPDETTRNAGIGLTTCRQLVEGFGGSISAEHLEPRGTRFTLAIPVDDLRLSLRSWLIRQANDRTAGQPIHCSAFGLRIGSGLAPSEADQRLQLSIGTDEYLHRASADRWILFTTAPPATYRKLKSLAEELRSYHDAPQLRFFHISSSEPLSTTQDSFSKMQQVPEIAESIFQSVGQMLEDEIPMLDDLQLDFGHLYSKSLLRRHGQLRRTDTAQSGPRRPSEAYQRTPGDYQWTPAESKRMTSELNDLAHGWKRTQDKLQKAHR